MTREDEAYWLGFTAGRNDRKAARAAGDPSGYWQRHDCLLGPTFSTGHRDGWNTYPTKEG